MNPRDRMVVFKCWRETWMRALIPAVILVIFAISDLVYYDPARWLAAPPRERGAVLKFAANALAAMPATYDTYVWSKWFGGPMPMLAPAMAFLMGAAALVSRTECMKLGGSIGGATSFLLSLPVSRRRWVWARAAVAAAELLLLFLVPSLILQRSMGSVVMAIAMWAASLVYFAAAGVISAWFNDEQWVIVVGMIFALAPVFSERLVRWPAESAFYRLLAGFDYMTSGTIPWLSGAMALLTAAALVQVSVWIVERKDY